MASMHENTRAASLMTDNERSDLIRQGWHCDVVESLRRRGFRPCKPDYVAARFEDVDIARTMGFIRQTALPHLHITVERGEDVEEVIDLIDTAIFDAGRLSGHESLASRFMQFFNACKNWRPAPDITTLEKRLAALEQQLSQTTPNPHE